MTLCWLDIRAVAGDARAAIIEEAVHQRIDGIAASDPGQLAGLPPTVTRVLLPGSNHQDLPPDAADVVIVPYGQRPPRLLAAAGRDMVHGRFVEVVDGPTLEDACVSAREDAWSVLLFRDPTKLPLEIVIAAASGAGGNIMTIAADPQEAAVIFGVLEHGPAGV